MNYKTYLTLSITMLTLLVAPGCWGNKENKAEQKTEKVIKQPAEKTSAPEKTQDHAAGVRHITTAAEFEASLKEAKEQGKPVIAKLYAPWCGPCQALAPIFERTAAKTPDAIFLSISHDETGTREIFEKYGVNRFPTCICINTAGKVVAKREGGASESDFADITKSFIKKAGNP